MKLNRGVLPLAIALGSVCAALAQEAPTPIVLSNTSFDVNAVGDWEYGYFYSADGTGRFTVTPSASVGGDPENFVWRYQFDTAGLEANTGFGTGTGGRLSMTPEGTVGSFISGNRDDYTVSFDARALGLAAGQTTANAQMELQFFAGDTKQIQVNIPFNPTSELQTFTFNLGAFSLGDSTTDATFEAGHLNLDRVRFNVNMHQPGAQFGFDAGNELQLDNVKVSVTPPAGEPEVLVPEIIADWNFDDKPLWFSYGPWTWAEKTAQPIYNYGASIAPNVNNLGVEGSGAFWVSMNNFPLFDEGPAWAGGGAGGGGPIVTTHFTTTDLTKYRVTYDARVQGLNVNNGRTSATGKVQLHFQAADDTKLPADADTDNDALGRIDFETPGITAEFQTFSFLFSRGQVNDTTREALAAALETVIAINMQVQIENAADANVWDWDEDNFLIVDNVKIERLYPEGGDGGPGELSYAKEGNELVLTWTIPTSGVTTLQSSELVDGEYTNVTTEGNTHRVPLDGTQRYFRLNWIGL